MAARLMGLPALTTMLAVGCLRAGAHNCTDEACQLETGKAVCSSSSAFCADTNVSGWGLDTNLVAAGLKGDDGSGEFALGVLLDALTLPPPQAPPLGDASRVAHQAFDIAKRSYRRRAEAAVEAAVYLMRDGRLGNLPRQLMVEVDTPVTAVTFKPATRGKVSPTKRVMPVLTQAFDRYVQDPDHPDYARRFLMWLLSFRGIDEGGLPAFDVNLKTPDALAVSQRPLLMQCLEIVKLDMDLCEAIVAADHDLRPCVVIAAARVGIAVGVRARLIECRSAVLSVAARCAAAAAAAAAHGGGGRGGEWWRRQKLKGVSPQRKQVGC
jgi:hypothetical protein